LSRERENRTCRGNERGAGDRRAEVGESRVRAGGEKTEHEGEMRLELEKEG
jgi:hypothetical protein